MVTGARNVVEPRSPRLAPLRGTTSASDSLEDQRDLGFELHDGPGQLMAGIALLAHQYAGTIPADSPWKSRLARFAELAETAKRQIDEVAYGLVHRGATQPGIRSALHDLARDFERDSGITVLVRFQGSAKPLKRETEKAVWRISHQAMMNAWRHAGCSAVRLELSFVPHEVALTVADDGVGLGRRWESREGRLGIASMRRAAARAEGALKMSGIQPHGVRVEARFPLAEKT